MVPPTPFPSAEADRGYRSQRSSVLVDHHGLERLRRSHALVLLRFAHVLRDQTDHVAAERQERQDRQRHLKRRLHRTSHRRRRFLQKVRPSQCHGVRRSARSVVLIHGRRGRPPYRIICEEWTKSTTKLTRQRFRPMNNCYKKVKTRF